MNDFGYDQGFGGFLPQPSIDEKELFRQRQISRLNEILEETDHKNNVLRLENEDLRQALQKANNDLASYKDTLKKFYVQYCEQQKQLDIMKAQTMDIQKDFNRFGEQNLDMKNEVNTLQLDRDLLINKLEIGDKQYHNEMQSISQQLNDKNQEIGDLRRRVNELLELKRKSEEEIQQLRFQLNHQTQKLENELRERILKFDQLDRQYIDTLYLKDRDLSDALERIKSLENEIRRLLDLNKHYAYELSMLSRDNKFKSEEIEHKIQIQTQKEYIQQPNISIQSAGMQPRPPAIWQKKLHEQIDKIMDSYDKAHQRQLKMFAMTIWKLKFLLIAGQKQNKVIINQNSELVHSRGGKEDYKLSIFIVEGLIALISFVREAITNVIFEVFIRSVNHATQKRTNSFLIFITNIKELRLRYWKGLQIVLEVYSKMRKCLRGSLPIVLETHMQNGLDQKIELATGKLMVHEKTFRNNVNKWLESTLVFAIEKKNHEQLEKNQDFLFLFRLLTVKYRIAYPLKGKTFQVDTDIEIFLEHKICYALRKLLSTEPE